MWLNCQIKTNNDSPKYQPWHKFHPLKGQSMVPLSPCSGRRVGEFIVLGLELEEIRTSLILSWMYLHAFFLPSSCYSWEKSWMQSRKYEKNKEQGLWIKTYLGSNLSPAISGCDTLGSGRCSLWGLRICSIKYRSIVCRIVVGWLKEKPLLAFFTLQKG